ncbi:MAG: hypothetical protein JXQ65_13820 [Candidatus Marinimicrobia bacterium]|nr:hypothetical protein [Candidatus Neomarinimicrobiota bacterium]
MRIFWASVLVCIFLQFTSCEKDDLKAWQTEISGVWQLTKSSSDKIDSLVAYYLIFENGQIYSMNHEFGQPILDLHSIEYSVNDGLLSFQHDGVDFDYSWNLNRKKDTLVIDNKKNWYKFARTLKIPDYENIIHEKGRHNLGYLEENDIDEASGIVASRKNPGLLWTHNDSGSEPRIFGIDYHGKSVVELWLDNCDLIDCEDIALMQLDGRDFILLADIGDNDAKRPEVFIYLIPEMDIDLSLQNQSLALTNIRKITLNYCDGQRDAESLTTLPNNEIMIISKREESNRIYTAKISLNSDRVTLNYKMDIPIKNTVGADLLDQGEMLIFKNYEKVYGMVFDYETNLPNVYTLKSMHYEPEPQGEALCWDLEEKGYFTLSEERFGNEAFLYYYPYSAFWMR